MAVNGVESLMAKYGEEKARVLKTLVAAKRAPVTIHEILAAGGVSSRSGGGDRVGPLEGRGRGLGDGGEPECMLGKQGPSSRNNSTAASPRRWCSSASMSCTGPKRVDVLREHGI